MREAMKDDPEYEADFQRLITEQGIGRHEFSRDLPEGFGFDEPPLYAHYGQLGFLDGYPSRRRTRSSSGRPSAISARSSTVVMTSTAWSPSRAGTNGGTTARSTLYWSATYQTCR